MIKPMPRMNPTDKGSTNPFEGLILRSEVLPPDKEDFRFPIWNLGELAEQDALYGNSVTSTSEYAPLSELMEQLIDGTIPVGFHSSAPSLSCEDINAMHSQNICTPPPRFIIPTREDGKSTTKQPSTPYAPHLGPHERQNSMTDGLFSTSDPISTASQGNIPNQDINETCCPSRSSSPTDPELALKSGEAYDLII
ncbi:hypothetical protein G7Y89_g12803 [Cudoniella acicularis]|uniref:Uncharacterized protein n=1 Tax=Cudoniella acicularis TaxID=354080 RepID=A0A8H4R8I3_9HELO|nr:hypothetical protein G7Y89_g12803 [Cudoniella acicularis]